ncbi:MAG: dienelactone hydrolase family protein [Chloroflexota bacterium]
MNRKANVLLLALGLLMLFPVAALAQGGTLAITSEDVNVMSGEQAYESYIAAPASGGPYPAIVLIHSFNGLQDGYRDMTDQFAAEGFVVLAVGWQTFRRSPSDDTMRTLMEDSIAFLRERGDVDGERIGLTGFCAGGRYTMLFMPQVPEFMAGVAWYGFPNAGDNPPSVFVDDLVDPMLIIHGTADRPSPIGDIYDYAETLDAAGSPFEMKIYQGEPHGFMLVDGELNTNDVATDAFNEMVDFFQRKLG